MMLPALVAVAITVEQLAPAPVRLARAIGVIAILAGVAAFILA